MGAEPTVESLRATYEALVNAARDVDAERLGTELRSLRLPNPAALLARLFGDDAAAMAATYEALISTREEVLAAILREIATRGELAEDVDVKVFTVKEMREEQLFVERLRPFALAPDVTFGFVLSAIMLPFWVFEAGAWRYLGDLGVLTPERPTAKGLEQRLLLVAELFQSAPADSLYALNTLVLPRHQAWFAEMFGEAAAIGLSAEYEEHLASGAMRDIAVKLTEDVYAAAAARANRDEIVLVEGFSSPYSSNATGLQRAALAAMSRPTPLYLVTIPSAYQLSSFVFVDGHWRWIGKLQALAAAPSWQPATSYAADAAGLARLIVDSTHRAATGSLDASALLLPDAEAWLAARVGVEAARVLAPLQADPQRIANTFTGAAAAELFVVDAAPLADDPGATMSQQLWRTLVPGGEAHGAHHRGPDERGLRSSWVYVAGAWRNLYLPALELLPAWREHLRYPWPEEPSSARFPPTPAGLSALLHELARCVRRDRGLFGYLFAALLAPRPEPSWFALLVDDEAKRVEAAASLAEDASRFADMIEQRLALGDRHSFVVLPTLRSNDVHMVLWQSPSDDSHERCIGPVVFCDGAWRLLATRIGWTEELGG